MNIPRRYAYKSTERETQYLLGCCHDWHFN